MIASLYELCLKPSALLLTSLSYIPTDLHDDLRKHMTREQQLQLFNGEYKRWTNDGSKLITHCFYNTNGKLHGTYHRWFYDGTWQKCHYYNGKLHGEYQRWTGGWCLFVHCYYIHGIRQGAYYDKHIQQNGRFTTVYCSYLNGQCNGEFKMYRNDTTLIRYAWFRRGTCIENHLYPGF